MNVLIIEDNLQLLNDLVSQLKQQGIHAHPAVSGEEGNYLLNNYAIDLVILDLGLEGVDGLTLLKNWRTKGNTVPVLILTARDNWADKVDGLNAGADDYLTKPFIFDELLARINALYRRIHGVAASDVTVGPFTIDFNAKRIKVNGSLIEFSAYEYQLIHCLLLNRDKVISKKKLRSEVYGDEYSDDNNVIPVLLSRIRKKVLRELDYDPILTIRNQGYKLCP